MHGATPGEDTQGSFTIEFIFLQRINLGFLRSLMQFHQLAVNNLHHVRYLGEACYQKLEGEEGSFESPDYPANYLPNQICNYDIVRPSPTFCGVRIFCKFLLFSFAFIVTQLDPVFS